MTLEWYSYLAVVIVGFVSGFINTLAGGGSLITLPLLIFLGFPATVANGTNRVAILLQNVVAVSSFRQKGLLNIKDGLLLTTPVVFGSLLGAQIAVSIDEVIMERVIGILMVIMLVILLFRPKRWLTNRRYEKMQKPNLLSILVFFAIGMYGGFIQAGVGIFLLASLVLISNYELVQANAVKVLIVFCFTIFSLAIFIYNDQVDWQIGLVLAIGSASGAWVASQMAVKHGAPFIRQLLICIVLVSAAKLLGIFNLIGIMF